MFVLKVWIYENTTNFAVNKVSLFHFQDLKFQVYLKMFWTFYQDFKDSNSEGILNNYEAQSYLIPIREIPPKGQKLHSQTLNNHLNNDIFYKIKMDTHMHFTSDHVFEDHHLEGLLTWEVFPLKLGEGIKVCTSISFLF